MKTPNVTSLHRRHGSTIIDHHEPLINQYFSTVSMNHESINDNDDEPYSQYCLVPPLHRMIFRDSSFLNPLQSSLFSSAHCYSHNLYHQWGRANQFKANINHYQSSSIINPPNASNQPSSTVPQPSFTNPGCLNRYADPRCCWPRTQKPSAAPQRCRCTWASTWIPRICRAWRIFVSASAAEQPTMQH